MELFVVNRFVDESGITPTTPSQSSILEKLHQKADERKRQKELREQESSHIGRKKRKKKKKRQAESEEIIDGKIGEEEKINSSQDGIDERNKMEESRKSGGMEEPELKDKGGEYNLDLETTRNDGTSRKRKKKKKRLSEGDPKWDAVDEDVGQSHVPDDDGNFSGEKRKKKRRKDNYDEDEMGNDSTNMEEEMLGVGPVGSPKMKSSKRGTLEGPGKDVELFQEIVDDDKHQEGQLKHPQKQRRKKKRRDDKPVKDEDATRDEEDGLGNEPEEEKVNEKLFPVLGNFSHAKKEKVTRVLPEWLAKPIRISSDIQHHSVSLDCVRGLDDRILSALHDMNIKSFFPVQGKVIPLILQCARHGIYTGPAGYRPGDMCVAAPTGSGKTLAFAVPIVQILLQRVVQRFRVLVVLPTKNLTAQVYKVFLQLCKKTPLKVVCIGGQRTVQQEESLLVKQSPSDGSIQCLGDILVATPGRLLDHINNTKGFTLKYLRFLIIDEADSMMVQLSKDWITRVEQAVFGEDPSDGTTRKLRTTITVDSESRLEMPFQKILFSATLSHNPEQLMHLKLFQPQLVTSVGSQHVQQLSNGDGQKQQGYVTPASLEECYIVCESGERPLIILHLLKNLQFSQVLCFTNSVESSHRLYLLMELMGDGIKVGEFSSKLSGAQRQYMIKQFKNESIQLLICSDAMTRGMDLSNVRYVVSYEPPQRLKTYIHRIGRTARAGRKGTAYTIILQGEIGKFQRMIGDFSSKSIQKVTVDNDKLDKFTDDYRNSLKKLPGYLKGEVYHQKNR